MKNNTTNLDQPTVAQTQSEFVKLGQTPEDIDQRISIGRNTVAYALVDGTLTSENRPIKEFNVSTVVRTATGTYKVLFKNRRRDSLYLVVASASGRLFASPDTLTKESFTLTTEDHAGTLTDASRIHITVMDDKL